MCHRFSRVVPAVTNAGYGVSGTLGGQAKEDSESRSAGRHDGTDHRDECMRQDADPPVERECYRGGETHGGTLLFCGIVSPGFRSTAGRLAAPWASHLSSRSAGLK
jgi:hypothetical protein